MYEVQKRGATERPVVDQSGEVSRTKQSFREEVNINSIVRKYRSGVLVTHLNNKAPMYGDVSHALDLQAALNLVHEAEESFMDLPPEVRKAAQNDPVRLLEMLATEEGTQELVEAGLDGDIPRIGDPEPEVPVEAPEAPAEG